MPSNSQYIVIEKYRGVNICHVNNRNFNSRWISVEINGGLSIIALTTVKAAKNVIDTYLRFNHTGSDNRE